MNILLTGGAGYIGSHVAVALEKAGHSIVIYDNFSNSSKAVLKNIALILGREVACIDCDIRDSKLLTQTMNQFSIGTVIHLAGLKAVGESVTNPLEYYENNVQG